MTHEERARKWLDSRGLAPRPDLARSLAAQFAEVAQSAEVAPLRTTAFVQDLEERIGLLEAAMDPEQRVYALCYEAMGGPVPPVGPPLHVKIRLMREALEMAEANLFHRRKEHINDRCGRMYQTTCEVCDSEESYRAARAKVQP